VNTSTLLEGFIRLLSAVYYGGGDGLLAVPPERRKYLQEHWWDFLKSTSKAAVGRGRIGIFDAGEKKAYWLEAER